MKLAVLTDSHAGVRSDSTVFLDNAQKFYQNVFFPKIAETGINRILHLGDILDRRKYINFVTAKRLRQDFIEPMTNMGLTMDHVLGNHDVYYKDTNAVSGVIELYGNSHYPINIIEEVTETVYDGLPICLVPWMCDENRSRSETLIRQSKARVAMGHLELNGFEMNKGSVMDHGMDPDLFANFDIVASGHFHHPSQGGAIRYLGAMGQYDWGDFADPRGFHIFDTDTRTFEFVDNPYAIFHKVIYNDDTMSKDQILAQISADVLAGTYVKVIVEAKSNATFFDQFMEALEQVGPEDYQVIEEHLNVQLYKAEDIVSEAEDTPTIMRKYVEQINSPLDCNVLNRILLETYREAITAN